MWQRCQRPSKAHKNRPDSRNPQRILKESSKNPQRIFKETIDFSLLFFSSFWEGEEEGGEGVEGRSAGQGVKVTSGA